MKLKNGTLITLNKYYGTLVVPFTSERGVYYLSLERRIKQYTKHIKTQFWAYAYQVIKK